MYEKEHIKGDNMVRRKSDKRILARQDGRDVTLFGNFEHAVGCHLEELLSQGKILRWEYEPKTFRFTYRKRERRYTPDFFVKIDDETCAWLEVKGYMPLIALQSMKRFRSVYPLFNYLIVGKNYFNRVRDNKGKCTACEVKAEYFNGLLSKAVGDFSCEKFCNLDFYENSHEY